MTFQTRRIIRSAPAFEQTEGINTVVQRSIGHMAKRNFTPFLVFDHFRFQAAQATTIGRFPDHPHRGQETVTYLLDTSVGGGIAHEDFMGSKGILGPGDLQFMIAGRGVVHAEMPVFYNHNNDDHIENESTIEGIQMGLDIPENKETAIQRTQTFMVKMCQLPILDSAGALMLFRVVHLDTSARQRGPQ